MSEQMYTLAEARQVLAKRECQVRGHDWAEVERERMECQRCGLVLAACHYESGYVTTATIDCAACEEGRRRD